MLPNAFVTLGLGLLPLLSIVVLSHLVNVVLLAAQGKATLQAALLWAVALALSSMLQSSGWQFGSLIRDPAQERLKAQIQGRVIATAQALPLSYFQPTAYYD